MMAIAVRIAVTGAAALGARLRGIEAALRRALADGLRAEARAVRDEARASAPRKTGRLKASIVAEEDHAGPFVAGRAPYARFVEFGTRTVPARPFLYPALLRARRGAGARLAALLARALRLK